MVKVKSTKAYYKQIRAAVEGKDSALAVLAGLQSSTAGYVRNAEGRVRGNADVTVPAFLVDAAATLLMERLTTRERQRAKTMFDESIAAGIVYHAAHPSRQKRGRAPIKPTPYKVAIKAISTSMGRTEDRARNAARAGAKHPAHLLLVPRITLK